MKIYLSEEKINSFCGNVLPLQLLCDEMDLTTEIITWRVEGEGVSLRTFENISEMLFTNGVLLTLLAPGAAEVIATYRGKDYVCPVEITPFHHAESDEEFGYFIGDFHDHTTNEHNHEKFIDREPPYQCDMIRTMAADGKMDFGVITDHSDSSNQRDFFRGFTDDRLTDPKTLIMFPGSESEVNIFETDRFGLEHKNSGEIVTVNANNMSAADDWDQYFSDLADSPFLISCLAHPQAIGHSRGGTWNFCLEKHRTPKHYEHIKLVEMGDGGDRHANLANEYVYSVALDNGFRVCTTCSSDAHGPVWGYDRFPGKTVFMAKEKSKEAFIDAIRSNRVYACMSGNVKLRYSVNGKVAPADLADTDTYEFHASISYFEDKPDTYIRRCQIISDYGKPVAEFDVADPAGFEFTVKSNTARYFFLRMWDEEGRKVWSCPVWTGRAIDPVPADDVVPFDKATFTCKDEVTGTDASILINDNPEIAWRSDAPTASILIDMQEEKELCALSHYAERLGHKSIKEEGLTPPDKFARFPSVFRISSSIDGENFELCEEGIFRVFGGEEIIRFAPRRARYVRLEILSTVGKNSHRKAFADAGVVMAEISPFGKK